jgi:hypothetical protein
MIAHVSGFPGGGAGAARARGRHQRPPRGQGLAADADSREKETETERKTLTMERTFAAPAQRVFDDQAPASHSGVLSSAQGSEAQTRRSDGQCGPGGGRTHDQSIMSRPPLNALLSCENAAQR